LRAIIFANGIFKDPEKARSEINSEDLLIAADGGTLHCLEIGLIPDVVIGDLDSLPKPQWDELKDQDTQFILHPRDKDKTDLELALSYAVEKGAQEIIFLGLTGGRLDQYLANLLLLSRTEWNNARLAVWSGMDKAFLLHSNDHIQIEGQAGDVVSLIPLTPMVSEVTTQGLKWPLKAADLQFGNTLSISNEILQSPVQVQIGEGCLFVVHRGENNAFIEGGKS
jgi:thiamine pyrophosphokinase